MPLSLQLLKVTDPLHFWFMTVALLHCNEGWRKRAPYFTLINGWAVLQSCWKQNTLCLSICIFVCICFFYQASLSVQFLSSCQTLDQSIYQSDSTSLHQLSTVKWLYRQRRVTRRLQRAGRRVCLPVTSTTSDSSAPATISMTDWPPTFCWLTGEEAWGTKGKDWKIF